MSFDSSSDNYLKSSDHAKGTDLELFCTQFKGKKFGKMLDVASATGHFANVCDADVKIITDLSKNMLKKADEAFGLSLSTVSDAECLPFRSDTFDITGCRIAMHHFKNPQVFMKETCRTLKKGGYFVLIDSVLEDDEQFFNYVEKVRDNTHNRTLSIEDITDMADSAGFTTQEFTLFPKKHDFKEWAKRLNPSEEVFQSIEAAFLSMSLQHRRKFKVEIKDGRVVSYTDRKAMFIFRKEF